jgi:DNA polymerase-4
VCRERLRLSEEVGSRVRARGFAARTIGIKIRYADFRTVTRVRTLPSWTASTGEIYETAVALYRSLDLDQPRIRLVGVKCEALRETGTVSEQLTLDLTAEPGDAPARTRADHAIDAARERFGAAAVQPGTLVAAPSGRSDAGRAGAVEQSGGAAV